MFFRSIEHFAKHYQYTFQAITALGVFSLPFAWWQWKRKERETLSRNLVSISVIHISPSAVAEIKNTSVMDGSDLLVKVYKPTNFESVDKNPEFMKYVANSKESYMNKKKVLSNISEINWNSEPILSAQMSIGESVKFHLKDSKETNFFLHFAPLRIEISKPSEKIKKTKYMLFRYASVELREHYSDYFMKNELHPYGKWVLIFSENK